MPGQLQLPACSLHRSPAMGVHILATLSGQMPVALHHQALFFQLKPSCRSTSCWKHCPSAGWL